MSEELNRRVADQGLAAKAAETAKTTSRTFWSWFEQHHVDSLGVLGVTLVLSWRVVDFALDFPYDIEVKLNGTEKAAIIAAVLGPWGLMQAAMFKFNVELKGKKNGPSEAKP